MIKVARKQVTVETVLRKNYANPKGERPVKVRVTFNRVSKFFPVNLEGKPLLMTPDDLTLSQGAKPPKALRQKATIILKVRSLAELGVEKVTRDGRVFTWEAFEREFLQNDSLDGFLAIFQERLNWLKSENRIGTYKSYSNAYSAFKRFRQDKELSPFDVNVELLNAFDKYLQNRKCNRTTIGMYERVIKIIYNIAADRNPELMENYPFARKQSDRNKYKIRTGGGKKGDALSVEQIRKLIDVPTQLHTPIREARQLWLFSFHCRGMNMKDIAHLKYKDVHGDVIRYVRAKTRDTEMRESIMEIPITLPISEIINEIGNPDRRPSSYVFTIVPNGLASTVKKRTTTSKSLEERIDEIIRQKTKMVNHHLYALCKGSEVPELENIRLTTYWARHSFASIARDADEPVELISELLGHSDVRTTKSYLKRFDADRRRKVDDKILDLLRQK